MQELHGSPWPKKPNLTTESMHSPLSDQHTFVFTHPKAPKVLQGLCSKNPVENRNKLSARPSAIRRPSHDLFECLEQSKNKRFTESDAKYIFAQVVEVVDYLDRHGITHCDIKDENVVVDENLKVCKL